MLSSVLIVLTGCSESHGQSSVIRPVSDASFEEVERKVGCRSKYIDQKKYDIFTSRYKDHVMSWTGIVYSASEDSVSLDMNSRGIHELYVKFTNPKEGYDILIGSSITVQFVLRTQGGCIFPFSGDEAEIVGNI